MDKYIFLRNIASGSFGETFLVQDKNSSSHFVIKRANIRNIEKSKRIRSFNEIKILKLLNHPNIIKYRESFIDQNKYLCIVMQYAQQGDLSSLILKTNSEKKSIPEQHLKKYFSQILSAVHYLHQSNILHRDIKPENIFLDHNDHILLGDFGICILISTLLPTRPEKRRPGFCRHSFLYGSRTF